MSSNATGSDETLVDSYTTNDQISSTIAALADGGWVVTWFGLGPGDSDYGIYQQRYGGDGHAVGSETRVNIHTTNNQYHPTTTALADGGWVVTWDGEGPGDSTGIFQQRYAANGHAMGAETEVNRYSTNDQASASTTALSDGGWVVTWYGYGPGEGPNGIFQQRFTSDGHKVGPETLVNSYTTNNQFAPTTTALANGGWVVAWYGEGPGDSNGIFLQRYAANGHAVGTETLVNSYTTNSQDAPKITALPDGGWVVTWYGEGAGESAFGIFQQRYTGDGNTAGPETLVNSYTTNNQIDPATTALADGGWVVVWYGEGPGDSSGIFQQRYAADGDTVGGETRVNSYTTNNQVDPTITALGDGGWVVTWWGEGSGDGPNGVFQRHYAANIDGSTHADKLTGTGWGEYLIGYGGNDRLDGKGGNDVLAGGYGNDTYIVNSKGDQVQEWAAQGTDTVLASISYTLAGSVENLVLTGKASIAGTGNGLSNHITGNLGANTLKGLAGADFLTGGKGNDKLFGGADADHFIFLAGDGADKIMDFDSKGADHDVIDLSHVSGLSDFADLKAHHMEQHGSSVVIEFTAHDSVTLEGVKIKDLSAAEFHF
jgi:Ca2+-binding RTX toxin-like protein